MKKKVLSLILIAAFLVSCSKPEKSGIVTETPVTQNNALTETSEPDTAINDTDTQPSETSLEYLSQLGTISYISKADDKFYISGKTPYISSNNFTTYNTDTGNTTDKNISNNLTGDVFFSNDKIYSTYVNDQFCNIRETDISSGETSDIETTAIYISYIFAGDNSIYYIDMVTDTLNKYDKKTKSLSTIDLSQPDSQIYEIACCIDKEENIYIFSANSEETKKLFKIDRDFNTVFSNDSFNDMEGSISDVFISASGEPAIVTISEQTLYINTIDKITGNTIDRYEIYDAFNCLTGHTKYDIVYESDSEIYGYSFKDKTSEFLTESFRSEQSYVIGITSCNDLVIHSQNHFSPEPVTLVCNEAGEILDKITYQTEENLMVKNMFSDKKGNIYYTESHSELSDSHIIHRISSDKSHNSFEVSAFNNMSLCVFIAADESGNILIGEENDNTLYLSSYTPDGKLNAKLTLDDCISFNSVAFSDNKTCILYCAPNENTKFITLEQKSGSIEIIDTIENPEFNYIFSGNDSFDIFIKSQNSILGYNPDTAETVKVADLLSNGLLNARTIFSFGEDFITFSQDTCKIIKSGDPTTEKTLITLGGLYVPDSICERIIEFNQSNEKYYIEYNSYTDTPESKEKFNIDILTGKLDILAFHSYYNFNPYDYNKDIFADLYEYIDNDPEINRSDFFENILGLYTEKGRLYEIPTEFTAETLAVYSEKPIEKINWSIDGLIDYVSEKPENRTLEGRRDQLYAPFISACINDYTDRENNRCDFNNESFRKTLTYFKEKTRHIEFLHEKSDITEVLETNLFCLSSIEEDFYLKGYPCQSGNGIVASCSNTFSIMNNSKNKDGAWEFIRIFLLDEHQLTTIENYGDYPVIKSCFETLMKKECDTPEIAEANIRLASQADCLSLEYSRLYRIIEEEIFAYIEGISTIDEAVEKIQHKVTLYLNES